MVRVGLGRCAVVATLAASVLGCGARDALPTGAAGCTVRSFRGDQSGAWTVALDERYAYWTTAERRLQRGSLATGAVDNLAELTDEYAIVRSVGDALLVVDDTRILRVSKVDGSHEVLATDDHIPQRLVADADGIYVIDADPDAIDTLALQRVARWSPSGGFEAIHQVWSAEIGLDADNLYVAAQHSTDGQSPDLLAAVLQFDRVTGASTVFAEHVARLPFGVQANGTRVVVGTLEGNLLESWLHIFSGGSSSHVPLEGAISRSRADYDPVGLAIDGANAYVTASRFQGSRLVRVPLAGGPLEIALDVPDVQFVEPVVSATHVAVPVQRPRAHHETSEDFADVILFCK